jgi:hypothetical protein
MADTRPRRTSLLRHVLATAALAFGIGALLRLAPAPESARGTPGTPPSPQAVGAGYEPKDINARGTAMVLAAMAATTAVVISVVFVMVWRFDVARHAAWSDAMMRQVAPLPPPVPRLQVHPFRALADVQGREQKLLHSYGWLDADHSVARIPIDRAMTLSVGKSLDASP